MERIYQFCYYLKTLYNIYRMCFRATITEYLSLGYKKALVRYVTICVRHRLTKHAGAYVDKKSTLKPYVICIIFLRTNNAHRCWSLAYGPPLPVLRTKSVSTGNGTSISDSTFITFFKKNPFLHTFFKNDHKYKLW